jgi:murein DD-endopeptidase MepM/ murein hydrolase activator NlpD
MTDFYNSKICFYIVVSMAKRRAVFRFFRRAIIGVALFLLIGFLLPQRLVMPVVGATSSDYHPDSFWYYPWGKSVTHKGVDIFASRGTSVVSSTAGLVLYSGEWGMGGNVVFVLGPKWRLHYYAHLDEVKTNAWSIVKNSTPIGTVGDSGNARGKSPHLHYAIITPIPYPLRIDSSVHGWKKMFFLNPIDYFTFSPEVR